MQKTKQTKRLSEFQTSVTNKFHVYNSLFLNLPYGNIRNVGLLIPLLFEQCSEGLKEGKSPREIIESFFSTYVDMPEEQDRIDFMFKIIQYVERQVVLYDSVEDAAFSNLQAYSDSLSIKDYFELIEQNKNSDKIAEKLSSFSARIVLTAHPTQFYTPDVLDIIDDLRKLITTDKINDIDITLKQLGLTSLVNAKKPTPLNEARNIIYILRNTYYNAIGDLFQYIKSNIGQDHFDNYNLIRLGFWPGGDRDGNPFVTATTTAKVADELRVTLMKCYYKDLKALRKKLSFKGLEDPLDDLIRQLYQAMFDPSFIVSYKEMSEQLLAIKQILVDEYHGLYLEKLDEVIDKVHIFKNHFATLDIRQDHSQHIVVIESILKKEGVITSQINEISETELVDVLISRNIDADPADFENEIVKDTLTNIRQLKSIQEKNGEDGCNRYIISNSEDVFSVLFVFGLFRWCGWKTEDIPFDIVPLFETMKGMDAAGSVMKSLFEMPVYRQHLAQRNQRQTMMLGFSDGTKDGGYLKANWSILKTKETLSKVCAEHDVTALFFDGRGGPPARGGGMTHRFYASQTKDVANNEIQLTIQGQTITSTYGTRAQFMHNAEQLLTAGLSNNTPGREHVISPSNRKLIEKLSEISFEKYDALKQHDKFIPYLEKKSTLPYYTKANIGSRPGKRGKKKELTLNDLRAISFVGSWSQLKQNVPGYYGLGTALKALADQGQLDQVKQLYRDEPFFRTLMMNSMMALAKTNFDLTRYMKNDTEFGAFWTLIYSECELTKKMILEISDLKVLMENEQISRESIRMREKIVLPLLVIQQNALLHISESSPFTELYKKIVTRSLYGNINASRNSA